MEQEIRKATDWLNTHLDTTIIIQKREQDDIDQVHFKLSRVEIIQAVEGTDSYLDNAIVLTGKGSMLNSDGNLVPLPQDTYDIVTTELKVTNLTNGEIELNSARAKYKFSLE